MQQSEPENPERLVSAGVLASRLDYLHACPVCSGDQLRHYSRVPSLFNEGEFIHYERCAGCGTVLRNPRLPGDYRLSVYETKILADKYKQLNPKLQVHYAFMMRLISRLTSKHGVGRRLLDFGCGAGGFLVEARNADFDVHGLEVNRDLARHVRDTYDIPTHACTIEADEMADERFDVIVSSQVFEHLLDPRAALMTLMERLNRPGLLLIEVPNLLDIRERLHRGRRMNDSHLFYFTASSLSRLMSECGLRPVKVHQGLRPYRFLRSYGPRTPTALLEAGERILSSVGLRTGLSVIGVRG